MPKQNIVDYVRDVSNQEEEWYNWPLPRVLPDGVIIPSGLTPYEATCVMKMQMHERYANGCDADKIEAIDWIIRKWGRIKGLSSENVRAYALDDEKTILANGLYNVPSWSKALSIRFPGKYEIYDSRVSVALNALLILGADDGKKTRLFPMTDSQNTKIMSFRKMIKNYANVKNCEIIFDSEFYFEYLSLIREVAKKLSIETTRVEMILFAQAIPLGMGLRRHLIMLMSEEFRRALDKHSSSMRGGFPKGWCGDASDLLAKYLEHNEIPTYYVNGGYCPKPDGHDKNHGWLTDEGRKLIIDITADQFKCESGKPVIVEPYGNTLHEEPSKEQNGGSYHDFLNSSIADESKYLALIRLYNKIVDDGMLTFSVEKIGP